MAKKALINYFGVDDVMEITGYGQTKATTVIKHLNDELAGQGYITIAGKIPKSYFMSRFGLSYDGPRWSSGR